MHLKAKFQDEKYLSIIIWELRKFPWILDKIFIFDSTIEAAEYIKTSLITCKIFPSVAHSYDIYRYGQYTWNTLYAVEEIIGRRDIFDGVWLDEWDRKDFSGMKKTFYTREIFDLFKKKWFLIWLVAPELHWSSPWLLWWELHEDAVDMNLLFGTTSLLLN